MLRKLAREQRGEKGEGVDNVRSARWEGGKRFGGNKGLGEKTPTGKA